MQFLLSATQQSFLVFILLSPIPLGANRPWAWALLGAGCAILLFVHTALELLLGHSLSTTAKRVAPGIAALGLLAIWVWIQGISSLDHPFANPIWQEVSRDLGSPLPASISLAPAATGVTLFLIGTYATVFWIACRACRDENVAARFLTSFVFASVLYAGYGLYVQLFDLQTILWIKKWAYFRDLTSTFVNRNSYATFAGMGLIASLGLLLKLLHENFDHNTDRRQFVSTLIQLCLGRGLLPLIGIILTSSALLLTHSRAGLAVTTVAALLLLAVAYRVRLLPGRLFAVGGTILAGGFLYSALLSADVTFDRFGALATSESGRIPAYAVILDAIATEPVVGFGARTFEYVFETFKPEALAGTNWRYAHSTPLELLLEFGIPAAAVGMAAMVWLAASLVKGVLIRRRNRIYPVVGVALVCLVSLHALVDFSLQMPGLAACFALLAGMTFAQSWSSRA